MPAGTLGLHEGDNSVCVEVADPNVAAQHVVRGSQGDNMVRMARMGRGNGRLLVRHYNRCDLRRARSVALRTAVRLGWDPVAVAAALLGDQPTLF